MVGLSNKILKVLLSDTKTTSVNAVQPIRLCCAGDPGMLICGNAVR